MSAFGITKYEVVYSVGSSRNDEKRFVALVSPDGLAAKIRNLQAAGKEIFEVRISARA